MGVIEPCGLGEPVSYKDVKSIEDLKHDCLDSNRAFLSSLQESDFSGELMAQAVADAKKGRMSIPVKASSVIMVWVRCGCIRALGLSKGSGWTGPSK